MARRSALLRPIRDARRAGPPATLGYLVVILASSSPATAPAQAVSAAERRIADSIDGLTAEAVALLGRVVDIDSSTQNLDGVKAVGRVFREEFDRLGFETRWEEMPPRMHRAGHLIAERRGAAGKRLLLIGHLDTVLEGRRFERSGSRATGSGILDMKGGDIVLLYALKALHGAGALEGRRILVILTGDEEDAGLPIAESRRALFEAADRSDAALAFENAVEGTATVARRGASSWTLEVSGKSGHSSGIFREELGSGAIFEAARILEAFRSEVPDRYLTINPSVMAGGTTAEYDDVAKRGTAEGKTNVIPARVIVEGDLRFISAGQQQAAREKMRAIAGRSLPGTKAALTFSDEYPAMSPTEGNHRLLAALDRASRGLGLGEIRALDPGRRGAGDISFVAPRLDALDGLGIRGDGAHAPEEWADLDSLAPQIRRAALLIDRLTRE
jgi:glutamate carboxypeptidase